MYPYFLLVFLPLIFNVCCIGCGKNKSRLKITISLFFLLFYILLALRAKTIGVDLSNYQSMYVGYGKSGWNKLFALPQEIGYAVFCKLIYITGADFQVFLAIVALIEIIPLAVLYSKEIEDAPLTILLFLNIGIFSMLFSGLRQSIAIALGALAFLLLRKRKIVGYFLTVILAMTFHMSAFMLFFMYPLYYIKISKTTFVFIIPVILVIFIFNRAVFNFITRFFPEKYLHYTLESTNAYAMLALYVIFAIFTFYISDERKLDRDTIVLRNFLIFSVFLQIFAPIQSVAMRMNYYYIIFIPLLIPKTIKNSKQGMESLCRVAEIVMISFFTVYFFYSAYYGEDILSIFPYQFFWE